MSVATILPILVAFSASLLTFFSGFGLGTLLLPVFAVFYPAEAALAMTAIVHLSNNLFKLALMGRYAIARIVIHFGFPAIIGALLGAMIIVLLGRMEPWFSWQVSGWQFDVTLTGLVIGLLLVIFAAKTGLQRRVHHHMNRNNLKIGGLLSGFFGGLSGQQGAIRSVYLAHSGIDKFAFVGCSVWIATMIDVGRIGVYLSGGVSLPDWRVVLPPILAAFAGAMLGRALLTKTTLRSVHRIVAICLAVAGLGIAMGVL